MHFSKKPVVPFGVGTGISIFTQGANYLWPELMPPLVSGTLVAIGLVVIFFGLLSWAYERGRHEATDGAQTVADKELAEAHHEGVQLYARRPYCEDEFKSWTEDYGNWRRSTEKTLKDRFDSLVATFGVDLGNIPDEADEPITTDPEKKQYFNQDHKKLSFILDHILKRLQIIIQVRLK